MTRSRSGFTLVEVLVALVLVAVGVAALLTALNSAATSTGYLRDKAFAHWVATNRIVETRLATNPPANGITTGEVEFAGQRWQWRQTIANADFPSLRRIDVSVRPMPPAATALPARAPTVDGPGEWTVTVSGLLGAAVALANGAEPDWEPAPQGDAGDGTPNPPAGPDATAPTPGQAT
jgi:general secretion pathway protein I